jgi:hypothetical protein
VTLRVAVLIVCAAVGAFAVVELLSGRPGEWTKIAIAAGIACIAILFEARRYAGAPSTPGGSWVPTGERFVDPASGETTEVWMNRASGERQYRSLRS